MTKWLLLLLFLPLSALELSIQGGKEQNNAFSIIHLKHDVPFLCEEQKNDFDQTRKIVCLFERRPSQTFNPLNNNFFTITSETRDKNYLMVIVPHEKMRLLPIVFDLSRDTEIFSADVQMSNHWMIVGFMETMPLISSKPIPPEGINFPVTLDRGLTPFVGGLDIRGNPVLVSRVKDVSAYISVKRFYRAGNYEQALETAKNIVESYPNTVFKSELMLYKIRCYYKLEHNEELLDIAKKYLRIYSSDENVPEILAYIARAYSDMGLYIDADYFFDRLFTEHKNNHFAKLGLIFKAQQLESSGNSKKALKFYKQALHESKEPDIAARASFSLAQYYSEHGQVQEALYYAQKILDGYRVFFGDNMSESIEMATTFADRGQPTMAAEIEGAVLDKMSKSDPRYEVMLKNRGIWLAQAERKEDALAVLDDYLKRYKFGNFRDEVIRTKDSLFFENTEQNISQQISDYDQLIQQYGDDNIGRKALYKKAELLYKEGRYVEVLDMKSELSILDPVLYPLSEQLVKDAAVGLMQQALRTDACTDVIALSQEFDIKLSGEWDAGVFQCAMKGGDYDLARSLALPYLKIKDVEERMIWLYRYIKADFALGKYKETASAARELVILSKMESSDDYGGVYRILFDSEERLGNQDGMIESIKAIEKTFGLLYEDIERYTQMVTLAQNRKDNVMIESYALKVIQLQRSTGSYTQSPYIEFSLAGAFIASDKNKKALEVLQSLDKRDLVSEHRARQKYLEGTQLQKLSRALEAKKAFEAAVEAEPDSAWGKLAGDALGLLGQ